MLKMKMKMDAVEYSTEFSTLAIELTGPGVELPQRALVMMLIRGVDDAMPEWSARQRQALRQFKAQPTSVLMADFTDEAMLKKSGGNKKTMNASSSNTDKDDDWKENIIFSNCQRKAASRESAAQRAVARTTSTSTLEGKIATANPRPPLPVRRWRTPLSSTRSGKVSPRGKTKTSLSLWKNWCDG